MAFSEEYIGALREAHRIMGEGTDPICEQALSTGLCEGCCGGSVMLIPGEEEILDVADRVDVVRGEFKCCFDEGLCALGDGKPLGCKLGPLVSHLAGGDFMYSEEPLDVHEAFLPHGHWCGASFAFSADFRAKVSRVVDLLEVAGVWKRDGLFLRLNNVV
ncbi:hypothetical protein HOE67_03130 [Candidatus Peregrinibacteria bacterium]|jgi:hypothetical protein|nr:hypothetical protein [Candidatus Peregrinibacteria bacterium]MBT4056079.1 hypothetical protein [Candidatus Peregrinibacteria bacterium]